MIIDQLHSLSMYRKLDERFARIQTFLEHEPLAALPLGRILLDSEDFFVNVDSGEGRSASEARLEAHRRYIDVQICLSGEEQIGVRPLVDCQRIETPYDAECDILFFCDEPTVWVPMQPNICAVFFPHDAHAPLVGTSVIRKLVFKLRIQS